MSEGSSALVWQCVHCYKVFPGVPPGSFPFCPFCSRPQQPLQRSLCVNPNCGEQLFTPTAEYCHKCNAPQRQQQNTTPGPYSLDSKQLSTQTSPQPPSTTPELQRPTEGHGNRTSTGGSFQGGSGDTNNEEFFDAQSVLPQHQTAGHPPPSFRYRGPPPSSQSQGFRYLQLFGVQSQHDGHRGPSLGVGVPPMYLQEFGVQRHRFPPHMEMVHGQFPPSHGRPPLPPQPLASGTSPQQPPNSGKPPPGPKTLPPHTQLPPSLQPPSSQSSPQLQPGQPLASDTSSPQQPPGGGKLHSQPTLSSQKPTCDNAPSQKQESDNQMQVSTTHPPPEGSSASEPKTPLSPKPPLSHPSDIHPSSAATSSSTDKLQTKDHDHPSTVPHGQHKQQMKPSEDEDKGVKDLDVASGTREQSSILAQAITTPPETTASATDTPKVPSDHISDANKGDQKRTHEETSDELQLKDNDQSNTALPETTTSTTETPKPASDLSGIPDHSIASEDGDNSGANKGVQKQTAEGDEERSPAKLSRQEGGTKKEPIDKAAGSSQECTPTAQKQPKHLPSKQDSTANASSTPTEHDSQPDKQPNQRMGDSRVGSITYAAVTNQNQVSLFSLSSS